MILTGPEIKKEIEAGSIEIDPYVPENVGENALDLRLGSSLAWYIGEPGLAPILSTREQPPEMRTVEMPEEGFVLKKGRLYLGHTIETVYSNKFVSYLTGRSSVGRLGLAIHWTAGLIDVGFRGQITLEMVAVHDIRIFPGDRICNIIYHSVRGDIIEYRGRYYNDRGAVASKGCASEYGAFDQSRT